MRDAGHKIFFYQKPSYFFAGIHSVEDDIELIRSASFVHHQIRVFDLIARLNSFFEANSIKAASEPVSPSDVVINFNYDYFFLRKIFPNNIIVTIINDDFVAQARFLKGRHVIRALEKTCKMSDEVLCVSDPLCKQVANWCAPKLFLPWTSQTYVYPVAGHRNAVLLWAHINDRIDFDLISDVASGAPNIEIVLVGPVASKVKSRLNAICLRHKNIRSLQPASLDEIDFSDFFAAIIPYRKDRKDVEAVTASNKTFQLLSRGMPLIVSGMPNFLESEAVFKVSGSEQFLAALSECGRRFESLQASIQSLVESNTAESRLAYLERLIRDAKSE
ncbi:hypothetical protein C9975_05955 [Thalassospira xiamenensis]|nr:hypothetical protein C9975_05955 [Thalassospira xiamenensis]